MGAITLCLRGAPYFWFPAQADVKLRLERERPFVSLLLISRPVKLQQLRTALPSQRGEPLGDAPHPSSQDRVARLSPPFSLKGQFASFFFLRHFPSSALPLQEICVYHNAVLTKVSVWCGRPPLIPGGERVEGSMTDCPSQSEEIPRSLTLLQGRQKPPRVCSPLP